MAETNYKQATFAGGCFWCMEKPFKKLDGVQQVLSGFSGGHIENPTYEDVCSGETGHYEAIQVSLDPGMITFEELLEVFWRQIDPTDPGGQFCDRGTHYRTAIFYHSEEQKKTAHQSVWDIASLFEKPIVTNIIEFSNFYPAEEYHQDFHKKCPLRYKSYRIMSRRDSFIQNNWDKKEIG